MGLWGYGAKGLWGYGAMGLWGGWQLPNFS